jgi:hypothetical protein
MIKMENYIKLFWPEIYLSYTKVNSGYPKTGVDFIDKDYWSGISLE